MLHRKFTPNLRKIEIEITTACNLMKVETEGRRSKLGRSKLTGVASGGFPPEAPADPNVRN
jgi:hypothetical protein